MGKWEEKILLPLIESLDEVHCTAIIVCMVNGKKFEKEVKKYRIFFSIIPRKPSFVNEDRVQENSANRVPVSGDQVTYNSDD